MEGDPGKHGAGEASKEEGHRVSIMLGAAQS